MTTSWSSRRFACFNTLILASLMALGGCAVKTNNATPAPPMTPVQKAALVMADFSTELTDAQQVVVGLHQAKAFDDATNKLIENGFKQAALYGLDVDGLIGAGASATSINDGVGKIATQLDAIIASGTAGIKDPATQQKFIAAFGLVKSMLQVVTGYLNPTTAEVIHEPSGNRYLAGDLHSVGRAAVSARHEGPPGKSNENSRRVSRRGECELSEGDSYCRIWQLAFA